ncbi:MAG: PEP-CTERM sorting domain-containing protein [Rhodanobacteraceae bacterium]
MFNKKSIVIALAAALALGASGAAMAAPINVGGVLLDPTQTFNPVLQAIDLHETSVSSSDTTLSGYGVIASLNGASPVLGENFCPGCNLTFTFSYTLESQNGDKAVFDNGVANLYVIPAGTFNINDPASAVGTTPWLSLTGHTLAATGFSTVGQLYATIFGTISAPGAGSSGFGYFDVSGGVAGKYFNTNSEPGGSDLSLASSFQIPSPSFPNCTVTTGYPICGTANLSGLLVMPVPEPGELGMLGLGIGVLGFFFWRRRRESDDRA